jgi:predicted RNA binding protein YcfA (HicA-like mRNA interferase family)
MIKLPRPSGKDLIAALGKLGFQVIRIRGSHHYLRHGDGPRDARAAARR